VRKSCGFDSLCRKETISRPLPYLAAPEGSPRITCGDFMKEVQKKIWKQRLGREPAILDKVFQSCQECGATESIQLRNPNRPRPGKSPFSLCIRCLEVLGYLDILKRKGFVW
jgi:hypothetical protein